ncbi:MAG: ribonuclease P protein component [Phycisphaerales bacterium]|nr:ribonuclease P protein component [Phycisphaerales bacterium]
MPEPSEKNGASVKTTADGGGKPARLVFRKNQRLTHAKQYAKVYARRCSVNRAQVRIYAELNGTEPAITRLGLSVGRKFGPAVARNRFKRLIREAFRLSQRELPTGLDLIVQSHPHETLTLDGYRELLLGAARSLDHRLRGGREGRQEKRSKPDGR